MTVVKFVGTPSSPYSTAILQTTSDLAQKGIELAESPETADVLWVQDNLLTVDHLASGLPIIVESTTQQPDIYSDDILLRYTHPAVRLIVKSCLFTDKFLYNTKKVGKAEHIAILTKCLAPLEPRLLDITEYWHWCAFTAIGINKLRLGWNCAVWNTPEVSAAEKHIEITHFVPALTDMPALTLHADLAASAVASMPGTKATITPKRSLEEATAILKQSKFFVSPWGAEPIQPVDFIAASVGCIVVKPSIDYLITRPALPYVACRHDFSDLSDIVASVRTIKQPYAVAVSDIIAELVSELTATRSSQHNLEC